MNTKIKQIPTVKNFEHQIEHQKRNLDLELYKIDTELDRAIKLRQAKDQVNQWLHIFELVSILILLIAVIVEGFFIFNLSKKEPSTALIVTESDLLTLQTPPLEVIKEK